MRWETWNKWEEVAEFLLNTVINLSVPQNTGLVTVRLSASPSDMWLCFFLLQYIGTLDVPRPTSRVEIVAAMRRIRVSSTQSARGVWRGSEDSNKLMYGTSGTGSKQCCKELLCVNTAVWLVTSCPCGFVCGFFLEDWTLITTCKTTQPHNLQGRDWHRYHRRTANPDYINFLLWKREEKTEERYKETQKE
jgi:carboxyl-terminal PDZ ligand of neuronal nitric oxide synthase protein